MPKFGDMIIISYPKLSILKPDQSFVLTLGHDNCNINMPDTQSSCSNKQEDD